MVYGCSPAAGMGDRSVAIAEKPKFEAVRGGISRMTEKREFSNSNEYK
jgi:hypothetical protein